MTSQRDIERRLAALTGDDDADWLRDARENGFRVVFDDDLDENAEKVAELGDYNVYQEVES
ncbi:hypothetical protein [Haladaptatus sp. NG-SE-30]